MTDATLSTILDRRQQFLGFVQRRVADPALAEDILQAAYARALQHRGDLRRDESVVAWFRSVLRHAVIDFYRRRRTESTALAEWTRELETTAAATEQVHDEVCACLLAVLEALKPEYAEVLRAVDLQEQPLRDFAGEHGISPSNAAVRVHRARAALRRELLKTCGACAEHACLHCTCRWPG